MLQVNSVVQLTSSSEFDLVWVPEVRVRVPHQLKPVNLERYKPLSLCTVLLLLGLAWGRHTYVRMRPP